MVKVNECNQHMIDEIIQDQTNKQAERQTGR